jgi:hypothetical protein
VGAVLGWALDFCNIENWKWRIEKEEISLQSILENALPMAKEEREERISRVQEDLQRIDIRKQIEQVMEKERKEKEEVIRKFVEQEGVIICMGTPFGHMSSGGRHEKSYQVDHKKALVVDTSVATSQDQLWTLCFHSIPLIFEEPNGDRMFKLHSHTRLQIDGQVLSLQEILQGDQKALAFSSLSLKDEYCELDSQRSGIVRVEDGKILFKFH